MRLDAETLERFARKYIWWKKPEEAADRAERIVAQVMNIGDYDVESLVHEVGFFGVIWQSAWLDNV